MSRTGIGNFFAKHGQKLLALAFWLGIITAYVVYTLSEGIGPLETLSRLINWLKSHPLSPLIFILIYALRPLIFFSAAVLTIAGGFLFGPLWGFMIVLIAANLSATIAYLLGKYLAGDSFSHIAGDSIVSRYAKRLKTHSFETILTMRFLFLPYDLVNYLAGVLKVPYMPYILATILGSLPGSLAFVLAGASIEGDFNLAEGLPSLRPVTLVASVVIFGLSLGAARALRQKST